MDHTIARVEVLEQRRLLAGNVTVVAGENFSATITGDKKSNSIEVSLVGSDGYLIKGLSKTTINKSNELLLRTPTAANMKFLLGKGNDVVSFVGAFNTQTVSIFTGEGDDRVKISRVSHFGDLHIATERDKDSVTLDNVVVRDDLTIDTGDDKDTIALAAVQVGGDAKINGGRGKNTISGSSALAVAGAKSVRSLNSAKSDDDRKRDDDDNDDDKDDDDRDDDDKRRHDDD